MYNMVNTCITCVKMLTGREFMDTNSGYLLNLQLNLLKVFV